MGKQSHSVTLRICHPSIDPAEISDTLGLSPIGAWKAGGPRLTPRGRALGLARHSFWYCNVAKSGESGEDLASDVARLTAQLEPHAAFFHRIRSEGGSVEFFIGWFIEGMAGEEFGYELLARLGRLQIDLSFDLYGSDDEADEPTAPSPSSA